MKLSVIILNYNVKYFTDACLQTVLKAVGNRKDIEIIVADNHSTDGSKAYLEALYPDIRFLWFDQNHGFGKAYNKAVKQAKGNYLLFLNPDTLVSDTIIDEFETFARQHPGFGITGGKMIDGTGRFLPESKRGIPTPIVAFSKLTQLYKILNFKPFNSYYTIHLSENQTGKTDILTGALMFMKKDTFEKVGGFDEQFFMYGEDIDLSYRIKQLKKDNYYWPKAKIIHFKGESSRKDNRYFQNFLETTFQFYRKHFRSFPALEVLMKSFFKIWLKLKKTTPQVPERQHWHDVYFWGDQQYFKIIKQRYPKAQLFDHKNAINRQSMLLIFDMNTLPVSQIIATMESLKNKPINFRFYFPQRKMLLGSDHKDTLGKVVFL